MSRRYINSESWFNRAVERIPLGSQTFSKSITQYPFGAAPLFIMRAHGSVAIDVDGNRYIDLVASLGAITIGYADSKQNRAIRKQLKKGSIFSLPSKLELEVADLLYQIIPSAEKVRFFKNGTDATSGAIRLARAYSGRNHIIACGYHGWQDWYIAGTTKNLGIPEIYGSYIHNVKFGHLDEVKNKIEILNDDVAALILEPISNQIPTDNYIRELREICTEKGIVLIFDETVTGFRVSTGGAQELLKVVPDLSCFGKGIANGYPLSALVGKAEIMELMSKVFLSGTFGGDTISLTAGKYTINRYINEGIAESLREKGEKFNRALIESLSKNSNSLFSLTGHTSWLFHKWTLPEEIELDLVKTYFLQEILKKGVMALSTINVMHALSDRQISKCVEVYANVLNKIESNLSNEYFVSNLECDPIKPLFSVRNL